MYLQILMMEYNWGYGGSEFFKILEIQGVSLWIMDHLGVIESKTRLHIWGSLIVPLGYSIFSSSLGLNIVIILNSFRVDVFKLFVLQLFWAKKVVILMKFLLIESKFGLFIFQVLHQ